MSVGDGGGGNYSYFIPKEFLIMPMEMNAQMILKISPSLQLS